MKRMWTQMKYGKAISLFWHQKKKKKITGETGDLFRKCSV